MLTFGVFRSATVHMGAGVEPLVASTKRASPMARSERELESAKSWRACNFSLTFPHASAQTTATLSASPRQNLCNHIRCRKEISSSRPSHQQWPFQPARKGKCFFLATAFASLR